MSTLLCLLLSTLPAQPVNEPVPAPLLPFGPAIAAPDEFPKMEYTYIEASYVYLDNDSFNDTLDGWDLTGSFELPMNFFLQGTVRQQSGDVDVDRYVLGAGWHFGLVPRLDAYGILSWQSVDVNNSGADFSDSAVGAELGLRFSLTRSLELSGRYQWSDLDNSDASGGVGVRFYITERISAAANWDSGGGDQIIAVGARFEL